MHQKFIIGMIGHRTKMLFFVIGLCLSLQVKAYSPAYPVADSGMFINYTDMPKFPYEPVNTWAQNHLIYPTEALEANLGGKVWVRFIIDEEGLAHDIKIIRGSDSLLNQAALEVVQKMPRWQPARFKGKPCKISYTLPVIFNPDEAILYVTDEMPVFPEQYAWQWANAKARAYCRQFNREILTLHEKSFVSFIIEKDGHISSPEIARKSNYPGIDAKALEIVKSMPRWQPGKYKGKPVRIRYVVPVTFSSY